MNNGLLLYATLGVGVFVILVLVVIRLLPRRLKQSYFVSKWKELQSFCRDSENWPKALEEADKLLNYALKKQHYKGKSMGEKMVSAQKIFTDNDALWKAHNLFKKLSDKNTTSRVKESIVKDALIGYRQALRDIGALPKDE